MLNSASTIKNYVDDWQYIPKDAFLYFPSENDIRSGDGKTYIRKIFEGNVKFNNFEQNKINQLDEELRKQNKTLMPWFTRPNKLRFIQACNFEIQKSVKEVLNTNQWRLKTFPIQRSAFLDSQVQSGFIYICGRDHCYRPIIVIDLGRFDTNNAELQKPEFISRILAVFFEFMINQMFIEGQVQNYVMLINLNSLNMFTIGGIAKKVLLITNSMYRGRLYKAYIVNTSNGISFFWKFLKSYLSENTVNKIAMTQKPSHLGLFQHTNSFNVQQRFGGTMPNISGGFFPPHINQNNFLLPNERKEQKLVNEAQYLIYYKSGGLVERKVLRSLVQSPNANQKQSNANRESANFNHPFSPIRMDRQSVQSVQRQIKVAERQSQRSSRNSNNLNTGVSPNHMTVNNSQNQNQYKVQNHQPPIPIVQQNYNNNNNLPVIQQSLRHRDSLDSQMKIDLAFITTNGLGTNNSIVDIPTDDFPVHKSLSVQTFFQTRNYTGMKKSFNPSFKF